MLFIFCLYVLFVSVLSASSDQIPDRWQCGDGLTYIEMDYLCDGRNDCPDLSDENELHCGTTCEFKCHSGDQKCALSYQKCDGYPDCADWSDEADCELEECDGFRCRDDSTRCITFRDVCDRYSDCADSSDEMNCSISTSAPQTTTMSTVITTTTTTTTPMASTTGPKRIPRKCKKNPKKSKCHTFWNLLAATLTKKFMKRCTKKPNSKKCRNWRPVLDIKRETSPGDFIPSKCKRNPSIAKCKKYLREIAKQLPNKFITKCKAKPRNRKCKKFHAVLSLVPKH
uniref:Uncharacterized protein n=1 Tax=Ciona savignyi TaxID=51511 RepID=H2ZGU0_CIOSA